MKFRKKIEQQEKTEVQLFNEKFPRTNKKNSFYIEYDANGKILAIESENKDIIAYAKKLGLNIDG